MPATYAAVQASLSAAAARLAGFTPRSLLDAGAGPGTASWAALAVWPGLGQITLIERSSEMIGLGKRLAKHASQSLGASNWIQADLAGAWQAGQHDVVLMSYALGELADGQRDKLLRKLWEGCGSLLVIVEPGTPVGFDIVRKARELLLAQGAAMLAPCPHGGQCPMQGGNWCHFSARVARSRLHRQIKGADMAYEDEKYSYIALAKGLDAQPCAARVLRHPMLLKGHVKLELCTVDGLKSVTVAKSRGEDYHKARDLRWGDFL